MSAQDVTPTGPPQGNQSTGGRRGGVISQGGVDPEGDLSVPTPASGPSGATGPQPGRNAVNQPAPQPQSVFEQPGEGFRRQRSPFEVLAEQANPQDPDLLLRRMAAKYQNHPDLIRLLSTVDDA